MATQSPNPGFVPESWSLYGVGALFILLRLIGKLRRVGIKRLELDDAFIFFGLLWYTILCVSFNQIATGVGSNLMTPEEEAALTPTLKASRVTGSKWVFVSEHAMLLTIWSMKAAMLVLYARVTEGLRQRKILNGVIVWVCCAFLGDEVALFTICRPLSQYWAVPPTNSQCSSYQYYQIVNAVFNISTDILILAVGIPPVLVARLSIQQKLILGVIFGMGTFVIVAAILRAIYCLVPSLISYVYMNWYFREASVAVYVTTLPGIWVFLREMFPILQKLTSRHGTKPTNSRTDPDQQQSWRVPAKNRNRFNSKELDFDLDTYPISKSIVTATEHDMTDRGAGPGDHAAGDASSTSSARYDPSANEIRRDVTFTVERLPIERP
ncbi:uncharacterized protein Z518_06035 [Rhinocladiella mackenziei CBS 650.93]|uniref:Rhodopsin domain-containing protein n=1 Tax=Rhinocladiella mackenziei CBS 650.93 TaxID=1442369 RepID=A0A0D2H426_9EURO|nr:uncharacterized protein Z518_06035 [Rhinocladiella mackenziei CBS 650.93]KIX05163.1 hypothetical protein Z518_06035 [Rhinocladiella mackenziei CBS 650.93]